jgi:hypothetical protein
MDSNLKLLIYIITGLLFVWSGYKMYFSFFMKKSVKNVDLDFETPVVNPDPAGAPPPPKSQNKSQNKSSSGGLMICPVCSSKMDNGDMVKTKAFPSPRPYEKNRTMHILGCYYCMDGRRDRICPVCGKSISTTDYLIARMFDRTHGHTHVHVIGCTQCKTPKAT